MAGYDFQPGGGIKNPLQEYNVIFLFFFFTVEDETPSKTTLFALQHFFFLNRDFLMVLTIGIHSVISMLIKSLTEMNAALLLCCSLTLDD